MTSISTFFVAGRTIIRLHYWSISCNRCTRWKELNKILATASFLQSLGKLSQLAFVDLI